VNNQPPDPIDRQIHAEPALVPPERHGWRGLSVGGPTSAKRKVYTLLHNDRVLVTALLLMPGERSIRHSHETGELSVHFLDDMHPEVNWNPPGVLHGGAPALSAGLDDAIRAAAPIDYTNSEVAELARELDRLNAQVRALQERIRQLQRPATPRFIVDVLFPPFKTTIDDPAVPEKRTVVGQWYD
jgi:uncharacterized coiled-coil protein SlyX